MAYACTRNSAKECDGCQSCKPEAPPETGVRIKAIIKLEFTAYGDIEKELRAGEDVYDHAEYLVEDIIECCGNAGEDMTVDKIEYELND